MRRPGKNYSLAGRGPASAQAARVGEKECVCSTVAQVEQGDKRAEGAGSLWH